ncbi:MAG: ferritin-like domain-containing protein [Limisphaerales bacterium]
MNSNNNTLQNLFLEELEDMYDAEHRITKALPKLIEAATCSELKAGLEKHLRETEGQITKLESIFRVFDEEPSTAKCEAIVGILAEGDTIVKKNKKTPTINAAIISAAQKVEHYEIASYGCLKAWANILGKNEAVRLIDEILEQEKKADQTLNTLSASKNQEALEEVEPGALRR